jgi:hypothetical protein
MWFPDLEPEFAEVASKEIGGPVMAHLAMTADLQVVSLDGRISADRLHEEEIDLFSKGGTGIALGSSISSCDFCLQDSEGSS